ncbi:MAG: GIY-YIG nuclease family protein [Tissierellia bacterium]|nr:GIY-YIG nuclease family protein [Tissierellia bacterium]
MSRYFTYILELSDQTYYIGYTNNLWQRLSAHNEGRGAKRTRGRSPVLLKYYESFSSKSEAMKREAALKRLTREGKKMLIEGAHFSILELK